MDSQGPEEDYNETKNLSSRELIEKTRKATEDTAKALGIKIIHTKTPAH